MKQQALLQSNVPGIPVRRGKVRDIYDFGDKLLFVASDRISAYDWVLPDGIPDKGRVLTGLSEMWFKRLPIPNHLISTNPKDLPLPSGTDFDVLHGRSMVVRKTQVIPIECVVRGYLSGSGWKEYQQSGTVCGLKLPPGLKESDQLDEPIFTPATKVDDGHDENISFERMRQLVGDSLAYLLRDLSVDAYRKGAEYALAQGIIIADTKFEFGQIGEIVYLIDEVLTPDSSRFWDTQKYTPGREQVSLDKQFVRDWLTKTAKWDKNSDPPTLPKTVINRTRQRYVEAYVRLTGKSFSW
ncbi:MAG: phosphoribosylaminoimidazolesuccinocarboxamide synthase [Candidatus Andersenbacteria bacterium]